MLCARKDYCYCAESSRPRTGPLASTATQARFSQLAPMCAHARTRARAPTRSQTAVLAWHAGLHHRLRRRRRSASTKRCTRRACSAHPSRAGAAFRRGLSSSHTSHGCTRRRLARPRLSRSRSTMFCRGAAQRCGSGRARQSPTSSLRRLCAHSINTRSACARDTLCARVRARTCASCVRVVRSFARACVRAACCAHLW